MKIKSLQMKNFRCFKDTEIKFNDRLTVLIGENATGKTTAIHAVAALLCTVLNNEYKRGGYPNYLSHFIENDNIDTWDISFNTDLGKFSLTFDKELENVKQNIMLSDESKKDIGIFRFFSLSRSYVKNDNKTYNPSSVFDGIWREHWDYDEFLFWLYDRKYNELLRMQKNKNHTDITLDLVCKAVTSCLPEYEDLRVEIVNDKRTMLLTSKYDNKDINVQHLSSGYASIIAIVADLALRMAKDNPHSETMLQSKAVVLIDEIDLSLHPKWQQHVIDDLQRVFPNAQFIVTTHSPLVLSTVKPEEIVYLTREGDDIAVHYGQEMGIGTEGADAMRLMSHFMGVSSRPPEIEDKIERYFEFIDDDEYYSQAAIELRAELDEILKGDPVLAGADDEIARKKEFA